VSPVLSPSGGQGTPLRLACLDAEAPPLFSRWSAERGRVGFEPSVAELLGQELGRPVEWVRVPWADMLPAVRAHEADAVLCGQGITPARQLEVDFTTPYAVFHESVLVRRGTGIGSAEELVGRRVAAIVGSTNLRLAETFEGAVPVTFGEDGSDDVYADMLAALETGEVDAVVDDDVVFVPLGENDPRFEVAFTVKTGNRWGIGVAKDRPELLRELDDALDRVVADRRHRKVWEDWLPTLDYPFTDRSSKGA
jgi:polar amino acid transport system substrate-binding protein